MIHQDTEQLGYSIAGAARACSVAVHTIRCAIRNYDLTPRQIGRRSILARADLIRWIDSHPRYIANRARKETP